MGTRKPRLVLKKTKGKTSAWCCSVVPEDLMGEVEHAVHVWREENPGRKIPWIQVNEFLTEQGYPPPSDRCLRYHFSESHDVHD